MGVLQDVFEVGALGADTQVVEHRVALGKLELGRDGLRGLGRFDGAEELVGLARRSGIGLQGGKRRTFNIQ